MRHPVPAPEIESAEAAPSPASSKDPLQEIESDDECTPLPALEVHTPLPALEVQPTVNHVPPACMSDVPVMEYCLLRFPTLPLFFTNFVRADVADQK